MFGLLFVVCAGLLTGLQTSAWAGAQQYVPLADSVKMALHVAVSDRSAPEPVFKSTEEKILWLTEMSNRLAKRVPDYRTRLDLIKTARYEAQRAGLDPQLVLALIEVESGFRKYAVSSAGARGYMQVMPFWTRLIGNADPGMLFDMRSNIRYGCVILRHYMDIERDDLFRALGRYNGSLGKADYPNLIFGAWRARWQFQAVGSASAGTVSMRAQP
jgi:soluble lytic murein transglycosylase-like protein